MTEAVLNANQLAAGYRGHIVVDDLSFELIPGQILTLIGPNGAGKSTVLRTVAAQLPAISGSVALCGDDLNTLRERDIAKRLSVMLTDKLTAERMTCGDVAATGRYPYTGTLGILSEQDWQITRAAMEMVGAEALFNRSFREISDGQRQCVMLARAIAQEPAVLLLDEPTSFLDIRHKLHILSLLRRLVRERKLAVLMSLHELDLAQKFSDRILCIRNGKADKLGTPEEIFCGNYISALYGIDSGSYDALFSTAEPSPIGGKPQVFVIGGGGAGIPVYRQLYRAGIPFAAGVLHENDLDFPIARALAAQVITEHAFEPIQEAAEVEAEAVLLQCSEVICCIREFGSMNRGNVMLLRAAEAAQIPVRYQSAS